MDRDAAQPSVPLRVLLVEDNPGDARLIRERLTEVADPPFEVRHTETLATALQSADEAPPDVALLDLDLPDARGLETVRSFQEALPSVPVIVLTGRAAGEIARRALRAGAQDYLVKGEFSGQLLQRSVRYAVERKAATEEAARQQRRFRMLAEHIEEVFYLWDMEPDPPEVVYLSPAHERLTGRPPGEVLEDWRAFAALVHPDDRKRAMSEMKGRLSGERHSEYRIVRPDGEVRWIHDESYPVRGEEGKIQWVAGIARDITDQVELEEELRRDRARFEEVYREAPAFIATLRGPDHVFEMANPAYRELVGDRELIGHPKREALGADENEEVFEALDHVYGTGEPVHLHAAPFRIERGPGDEPRTVYRDVSYIPRKEGDETLGVLVLGTDVTREVEAREEAERSARLLSSVFETMAEGIMLAGADGVFRFVNRAAADLLGRPEEEIAGTPYNAGSWRIMAPEGGAFPDGELPVARVLRTGDPVHGVEHAVERPDGSRVVLSVNAAPVEMEDGSLGVVASIRDVTEQKEFEAQLEHRALHDYLTDLPNRALLRDRLDHALDRSRRTGEKLAVLFLDLDRFKTVNDSLGHDAGDRVLEEIARRLSGSVRDRDTVARVGGDEFTLLLEDVADEDAARETAGRLLEAVSAPLSLGTDRVRLDASVGIALHEPDAPGPETAATAADRIRGTDLVRRADRAMLRVKSLAGQRIAVAGDGEGEDLTGLLSREMRLREAVEGGELGTAYQPIFDLGTGRPVSVEALARWHDPEDGEIQPGQFIPLAEETGLIVPLGAQQLERACRNGLSWHETEANLGIHVNLSARQLSDPALLGTVRGVLERTTFPTERLTLEVTESAAMQEARKMDALKEMGVALAVDDFGTRYSTLAQVKRLNVDSLKIDRSFVANLVEDRRDRAIVEATLTLGRALGLRVVAEGIETEAQLALLRELGCHEGQGFGLARPMTAEQLLRWLEGEPEI